MRPVIYLILAVIFFSSEISAQGIRIEVPTGQPTIQAGIWAASNGDTVLVAPGTYLENINFRGKNIVVTSRYVLSGDPSDIEATIIDGSSPAHPDTASCVLIVSGEDTSAVLEGFTLTGGTGTKWIDEHGAGTFYEGGGILMTLSSPTIKNNLIIGNAAIRVGPGVSSAGGGGIRVGDGLPRIINNVIMNNEGMYGGGIVLNYTGAIIRNNIIFNNRVYRAVSAPTYGGGGIWAASNFAGGSKIIENNLIIGNSSSGTGPAPAGRGGGLVVWATSVTASNNIIWGNTQSSEGQIKVLSATLSLTYSAVEGGYTGTGNISTHPAFADSGLYLTPGSPCVDAGHPSSVYDDPEDGSNSGFAKWPSLGGLRNDMGVYGGPDRRVLSGFFLSKLNLTTVVNFGSIAPGDTATFELNLKNNGAGGLQVDSALTFLQTGVTVLTGFPFVMDPISTVPLTLQWIPGSEGILDDTLYVYHQASNLENPVVVSLTGEAILTSIDPPGAPTHFRLNQNYPNPFNPSTRIRYSVAKTTEVRLAVYNVLGEKITELVSGIKLPGEYEIVWNATGVASGIYFYRLDSAEYTETKKLVLIK